MLKATFSLPTDKLLIKRSLNELIQAAIYTHLPEQEHEGYKSRSGKLFKKIVFKAKHFRNSIELLFDSLDEIYKEKIAKAILLGNFTIGAIHISRNEVSIIDRKISEYINSIKIKSAACATIRDQFGKLIYLEPRDSRFIQIIHNNILEKYETLLGKPYENNLSIKTVWQAHKPTMIHYGNARHVCYLASFEIKASSDMLNFIIQTGIGSKIMQGCGWVDIIEKGGFSG